jgi:adenosyl cobinamide kinase/adenosyl cobinamide phosphate guanylyltransferase
VARLEDLREQWSPKIEFTYVYIKEAHPDDEWQMSINEDQQVVFDQPTTFVERMDLAETFVEKMDVQTRTLVDDITNKVKACYAAWPERIYVIDAGGTIVYKGGMGPFYFDPDDLEGFLEERYGLLT